PELAPGALGDVGGTYALAIDERIVTFSPASGALTYARGAPAESLAIVNANHGNVLARSPSGTFLFDAQGLRAEIEDQNVFPGFADDQWWRPDEDKLLPIDDSEPVQLPAATRARAELRGGFLLQSMDSDALLAWTPGGATRPLAEAEGVALVAAHPDRIAWSGRCPGLSCGLHVTDVATARTVDLPIDAAFTQQSGIARGRFSGDGRLLGVVFAPDVRGMRDFALVDLADGNVLARRMIGNGTFTNSPFGVPFDFNPDATRLVLADASRGARLLAIDTTTGEEVASTPNLPPVPSLASFDRVMTEATTPLFTGPAVSGLPSGLVLAAIDGERGDLTIADIDTGETRTIDVDGGGPVLGSSWGPALKALDGGFVAATNGKALWVPDTGDPVDLGPAVYVLPGDDTTGAWIVTRDESSADYALRRVDGRTGALGDVTIEVHAQPMYATATRFVRSSEGTFARPGGVELLDIATGDTTFVDLGTQYPNLTAIVGDEVAWFGNDCYQSSACTLQLTNIVTKRTRTLEVDTDYAQAAGGYGALYVRRADGIARVDLEDLSEETVPDSSTANFFSTTASGAVVFYTPGSVSMWQPGWETSRPLKVGNFVDIGMVAVRQRQPADAASDS
ncbi:MAG TPA: hypothetical protein VFX21_11455, partial [Acidimicrobiia bacterium]|nr:hypothetical protein [Acidimicrobiia bacterium]